MTCSCANCDFKKFQEDCTRSTAAMASGESSVSRAKHCVVQLGVYDRAAAKLAAANEGDSSTS